MSVLVENENGWFICSRSYLNKIYEKCTSEKFLNHKLEFRKEFFQIRTPYVMKSSASKLGQNLNREIPLKIEKKRRKNKAALVCDSLVDPVIHNGSLNLIQAARNLNYLDPPEISSLEWLENNLKAQEAAKKIQDPCLEPNIPSIYNNASNVSILKTFGEVEYAIPAQSTFHLCDVSNIQNLIGNKYDLIVLDPPWGNKSVRRKKQYTMLSSCESLIDLPIEELCRPGCLIVIWTTNNKKQIAFIQEKLFPKWCVSDFVTWHWVKVTQKGQYIHPIDWHHKKPYENLLLGRVPFSSDNSNMPPVQMPESKKIIVSIPSSIHSHKPPLIEVLKPYIAKQPNCLEIFARYLLPGWTSLGNEVLKLQNIKLFEKLD